MKMNAKIVCKYESVSVARAIAKALQPDNLRAPSDIKITTVAHGKQVTTSVKMDGRIETLLATLDDLLSCTCTAENVIG
ncbi:MAG: KEOPS complex subunit Pcc1 [Hadesarchaea archaeon]|nr:KEOPS complex subunit Pcc1 [Hadesarchaea archaeon]